MTYSQWRRRLSTLFSARDKASQQRVATLFRARNQRRSYNSVCRKIDAYALKYYIPEGAIINSEAYCDLLDNRLKHAVSFLSSSVLLL